MNGIVATEVLDRAAPKPLLETWGKNERMRHIPPVEWMVQKMDADIRRRIGLLYSSFSALPQTDSRWAAIETQFRALCRGIDRVTEGARHGRGANQPPADLSARIDWSINAAVASLNSLDPTLFGRRYPFQTFERSKAEPLYGALLAVIDRLHRLNVSIRSIDPSIDERLLAGLVRLETPLPESAMA